MQSIQTQIASLSCHIQYLNEFIILAHRNKTTVKLKSSIKNIKAAWLKNSNKNSNTIKNCHLQIKHWKMQEHTINNKYIFSQF